jgi:hypothetical protein
MKRVLLALVVLAGMVMAAPAMADHNWHGRYNCDNGYRHSYYHPRSAYGFYGYRPSYSNYSYRPYYSYRPTYRYGSGFYGYPSNRYGGYGGYSGYGVGYPRIYSPYGYSRYGYGGGYGYGGYGYGSGFGLNVYGGRGGGLYLSF